MKKKKFKKRLARLECYCLRKYGFSIFDVEIQQAIGVRKSLSEDKRAVSVGVKMLKVLKDKELSTLLTEVLLGIKIDS